MSVLNVESWMEDADWSAAVTPAMTSSAVSWSWNFPTLRRCVSMGKFYTLIWNCFELEMFIKI